MLQDLADPTQAVDTPISDEPNATTIDTAEEAPIVQAITPSDNPASSQTEEEARARLERIEEEMIARAMMGESDDALAQARAMQESIFAAITGSPALVNIQDTTDSPAVQEDDASGDDGTEVGTTRPPSPPPPPPPQDDVVIVDDPGPPPPPPDPADIVIVDDPARPPLPPDLAIAPTPPPAPHSGVPIWVEYPEDTSSPTEDELKDIEKLEEEESGRIKTAANHSSWEKRFFTDLGDPEYEPLNKARLTWVVKGVRGTREKPNYDKIMRSPVAFVGGYYWRLKFFPRGNRVSSLSMYVECSKTPFEDNCKTYDGHWTVRQGAADVDLDAVEPDLDMAVTAEMGTDQASTASSLSETGGGPDAGERSPSDCRSEAASEEGQETTESEGSVSEPELKWRLPVQFGVVVYNPQEPRTYDSEDSRHQFNHHATDWGWNNFCRDTDRIHVRDHAERRPMLQNDTLAFDAYIRIFKDPTNMLWWHKSDDEDRWNSRELAGICPINHARSYSSPAAAGMIPLLLLAPFRNVIQNVVCDGYLRFTDVKARPICFQIKRILALLRHQTIDMRSPAVTVDDLVVGLEELAETSAVDTDVLSFWDGLRRTLDHELQGSPFSSSLSDLFDGDGISAFQKSPFLKVSVQSLSTADAVERAVKPNGRKRLPKILFLEFDRQRFSSTTRSWSRLQEKITVDETLDLSSFVPEGQEGSYTLFGFTMHSGDRTSHRFYTIVRPGGPKSNWLVFQDDAVGSPSVKCLTNLEVSKLQSGSGSGSKRTSDVVYAAFYVRTGLVADFLPGRLEPFQLPSHLRAKGLISTIGTRGPSVEDSFGEPEGANDERRRKNGIKVEIHSAAGFNKHEGLFETYDLLSSNSTLDSKQVLKLNIPHATTNIKFREQVAKELGIENPLRICLWRIQDPLTGHHQSSWHLRPIYYSKQSKPRKDWERTYTSLDVEDPGPAFVHGYWMHILEESEVEKFSHISRPPVRPHDYDIPEHDLSSSDSDESGSESDESESAANDEESQDEASSPREHEEDSGNVEAAETTAAPNDAGNDDVTETPVAPDNAGSGDATENPSLQADIEAPAAPGAGNAPRPGGVFANFLTASYPDLDLQDPMAEITVREALFSQQTHEFMRRAETADGDFTGLDQTEGEMPQQGRSAELARRAAILAADNDAAFLASANLPPPPPPPAAVADGVPPPPAGAPPPPVPASSTTTTPRAQEEVVIVRRYPRCTCLSNDEAYASSIYFLQCFDPRTQSLRMVKSFIMMRLGDIEAEVKKQTGLTSETDIQLYCVGVNGNVVKYCQDMIPDFYEKNAGQQLIYQEVLPNEE